MKIEFFKIENEKQKKIRNIMIIFIVIMLVLTFFSKTVMNIFLPEVSVYQIEENVVADSIRIQGVVEAVAPYSVKMNGRRTIEAVEAAVNNYYEKGTVIYKLDVDENNESLEYEKDLEEKKTEYELYILTNDLSQKDKEKIETGEIDTFEDMMKDADYLRNQKSTLKSKLDTIKSEVDNLKEEIDREVLSESEKKIYELKSLITDIEYTKDEKQALLDDAQDFYNDLCEKCNKYEKEELIPEQLRTDRDLTKQSCDGLTKIIKELDSSLVDYQYEMTKITDSQEYQEKILETSEDSVKYKYNNKCKEYEDVQNEYEIVEQKYSDYKNKCEVLIYAREKYVDLLDFEKDVDDIKKRSFGDNIVMPVSGTIISLPYGAGDVVEKDDIVAMIVTKDKGYVLKGSFNKNHVETINNNTEIIVGSKGRYDNFQIEYMKSYYDSDNMDNMIAEFSIKADNISVGDSVAVVVFGESATYPKVIPTAGIREDSSGYYVYQFETVEVPFGERYIAKKVRIVDILAQNDSYAAIEANIDDNSYIIIDSSKPITEGEQVRLSNE